MLKCEICDAFLYSNEDYEELDSRIIIYQCSDCGNVESFIKDE